MYSKIWEKFRRHSKEKYITGKFSLKNDGWKPIFKGRKFEIKRIPNQKIWWKWKMLSISNLNSLKEKKRIDKARGRKFQVSITNQQSIKTL